MSTKRVILLVTFMVAMWGVAGITPAHAAVPASLTQVGEYAEDIYDAAKTCNCKSAESKFNKLQGAVKHVKTDVADQEANKNKLDKAVATLGSAMKSKNKQAEMESANTITYIAAEMSRPYSPAVPVEVTELDYYGRELEIWSAAKNMTRLQQAASGAKTAWQTVRPQVISHGGSTHARKFDSLMSQLAKAQTPADYGRLATPILDQVDMLEQVFTK
jgi:hypothetical protein